MKYFEDYPRILKDELYAKIYEHGFYYTSTFPQWSIQDIIDQLKRALSEL